jgi:Family of unknown function (DUF6325)
VSAAERARAPDASPIGPVQILVLGFVEDDFASRILPELRRLRDLGHVRLLDLLVVRKGERGEIEPQPIGELDDAEAREFGALVAALVGLGPDGEEERGEAQPLDDESVWYLTDAIPAGRGAAILLIEHRWAIPLRDGIAAAGGFALADEWIHPADLVAAGVAAARESGAFGA